jgi:hypothetical protein
MLRKAAGSNIVRLAMSFTALSVIDNSAPLIPVRLLPAPLVPVWVLDRALEFPDVDLRSAAATRFVVFERAHADALARASMMSSNLSR